MRKSPAADPRGPGLPGPPRVTVELSKISKHFGPVRACHEIDLTVRSGEILAILGENGAGKSTLMNILSGVVHPSSGQILLNGTANQIRNPHDALTHGIGMVHQHFMLVPTLTVAQNVTLGREPGGGVLKRSAIQAEVAQLARGHGLDLDPAAKVADLPVGMQQRVEIIKALYGGASMLILDEPTAVLTPSEAAHLFRSMREMAAAGQAIVFISHKLHEVKQVADRIVVLRRGEVVDECGPGESTASLASKMVGRTVSLQVQRPERQPSRNPVLQLERVRTSGHPALRDLSLTVGAGEIVGIAGVDGNGQLELELLLAGQVPLQGGQISVGAQRITGPDPRAIRQKLARIPSDRQRWGLVGQASLQENLHLADFASAPFARRGGLSNWRKMRSAALALMSEFDIRASGPQQLAGTLSGGNQQKVVIARETARKTPVLLAAQPTRGVDVGATEFIHRLLIRLRAEGVAILLISADLDEVLALSDRVAVMFEGRIVAETSDPDRDQVGAWMAGSGASA